MKKKIVTLLAAAAMTLAAANAFAAYTNGDLIEVVIDKSLTGAGSEVAYDLGSIATLSADVSTTVANIGAGSGTKYVAFFAYNSNSLTVGATAPVTAYIKNTSYPASLAAINTYYAANISGNVVNGDKGNPNSLYTKAFASGGSMGYFGVFNAAIASTTYSSLANLATTPISMQLYTIAAINTAGSAITAPNVAITIASNGDTIINQQSTPSTPIPAAAYLLGSGLLGLLGFRRKNNA